jgi:hypothetical protein
VNTAAVAFIGALLVAAFTVRFVFRNVDAALRSAILSDDEPD